MIHQPSHGTQGTISDTKIAVEEGEKLKIMLTGIIAERTGQSYEKVLADMERDNWMSPQDALNYGIIEKIL